MWKNVFRRISNKIDDIFLLDTKNRYHAIEGLRGLAVIMVFNVHFFSQYYLQNYHAENIYHTLFRSLHAGHIGVDIFFVLSGFLIWKILFINRKDYKIYLVDRVNRLMPAYLLNLLILSLGAFSFTKVAANIFFLPQIVPGFTFYNYVSWTLAWEWLFYITVFLVSLISMRHRRPALAILVAVFLTNFVLSYFVNQNALIIPDALRFSGFFIGILISEYYHRFTHQVFKILGYCSLPVIFSLSYIWGKYNTAIASNSFTLGFFYISVDIFAGFLIILLLNFRSVYNTVFEAKVLRIIGQISYTFYLTHALIGIPISSNLVKVTSELTMILSYIITMSITVALSTFLFSLTERQYLAARQKD